MNARMKPSISLVPTQGGLLHNFKARTKRSVSTRVLSANKSRRLVVVAPTKKGAKCVQAAYKKLQQQRYVLSN